MTAVKNYETVVTCVFGESWVRGQRFKGGGGWEEGGGRQVVKVR